MLQSIRAARHIVQKSEKFQFTVHLTHIDHKIKNNKKCNLVFFRGTNLYQSPDFTLNATSNSTQLKFQFSFIATLFKANKSAPLEPKYAEFKIFSAEENNVLLGHAKIDLKDYVWYNINESVSIPIQSKKLLNCYVNINISGKSTVSKDDISISRDSRSESSPSIPENESSGTSSKAVLPPWANESLQDFTTKDYQSSITTTDGKTEADSFPSSRPTHNLSSDDNSPLRAPEPPSNLSDTFNPDTNYFPSDNSNTTAAPIGNYKYSFSRQQSKDGKMSISNSRSATNSYISNKSEISFTNSIDQMNGSYEKETPVIQMVTLNRNPSRTNSLSRATLSRSNSVSRSSIMESVQPQPLFVATNTSSMPLNRSTSNPRSESSRSVHSDNVYKVDSPGSKKSSKVHLPQKKQVQNPNRIKSSNRNKDELPYPAFQGEPSYIPEKDNLFFENMKTNQTNDSRNSGTQNLPSFDNYPSPPSSAGNRRASRNGVNAPENLFFTPNKNAEKNDPHPSQVPSFYHLKNDYNFHSRHSSNTREYQHYTQNPFQYNPNTASTPSPISPQTTEQINKYQEMIKELNNKLAESHKKISFLEIELTHNHEELFKLQETDSHRAMENNRLKEEIRLLNSMPPTQSTSTSNEAHLTKTKQILEKQLDSANKSLENQIAIFEKERHRWEDENRNLKQQVREANEQGRVARESYNKRSYYNEHDTQLELDKIKLLEQQLAKTKLDLAESQASKEELALTLNTRISDMRKQLEAKESKSLWSI